MIYFTAPSRKEWFDWNWPLPFTDDMSKAAYWICNPSANYTISYEHISRMPRLKAIITPSTGTNHIDLKACKERNITVKCLLDDRKGLQTIKASSEFTFQLILHAIHRPFQQYKQYDRNDDAMRGNELCDKLVGIVGYGRIGKNIGKWCNAFGASYITYDLYSKKKELNRLFRVSDIVLISCNLDDSTIDMITKEQLDLMRPGTVLVNTARAEIIKEDDLIEWAKKGTNTFATDVMHGEVTGRAGESPLLEMANVIVTPHIAGTCFESQEKAARIALGLLIRERHDSESVDGVLGDK